MKLFILFIIYAEIIRIPCSSRKYTMSTSELYPSLDQNRLIFIPYDLTYPNSLYMGVTPGGGRVAFVVFLANNAYTLRAF